MKKEGERERKKIKERRKTSRLWRDRDGLWPCHRVPGDWATHSVVIRALQLATALRSKVQTDLIPLTKKANI